MNSIFRPNGQPLSWLNTVDILLVTLVMGFLLHDMQIGYRASPNPIYGSPLPLVRTERIPSLKVPISPKDQRQDESPKAIQSNAGGRQLGWIVVLLGGAIVVVAAPTFFVLYLHGFRARTGFSLNQQVLIELVRATNLSVVRILCIGYLFFRHLSPA